MQRRDFIKSGVMAAGAMAVPNILRAQGSKNRVRMGFIGVGNRGTQLMHIFMKNPLVEVTALCDIYEPYLKRDDSAFERLVALEMDNVIYQVHMYKPIRFTHQGANGRARPQPGTEIPYPDPERGVDKAKLRAYLQPVRDFQKRHNAKIFVGEFSACIYAPGAGQYLRDCISIFEEYGWDWTYHSFREALWWNVETVIDDKTGEPVPNKDNDRFRALVDGFRGQVSSSAAQ